MSVLGKSAIRGALASGDIRIMDDAGACLPEWEPLLRGEPVGTFQDPVGLQPASIDLHLGNEWLVPLHNMLRPITKCGYTSHHYATDSRLPVEYATTVADSFWIPAHGFVLVRTQEVIGISDRLFAKVEGRSSVGRVGLIVETAGVVDSGFQGSITLELCNMLPNPLLVHAGMRGCQIVFHRVEGDTEGGYQPRGKYAGQIATTGSKLHLDFPA